MEETGGGKKREKFMKNQNSAFFLGISHPSSRWNLGWFFGIGMRMREFREFGNEGNQGIWDGMRE